MSPREIGDREKALRAQREEWAKRAARSKVAEPKKVTEPRPAAAPPAKPAAEAEKEKGMRAKKTTKKPRSAPAKRRPAAKKRSAVVADRSPLAVGTFIVAGGSGGVTMEQIVKNFGVEPHPMRAKIHAAKHSLGFTIDYDHKARRYTAKAPHVRAA